MTILINIYDTIIPQLTVLCEFYIRVEKQSFDHLKIDDITPTEI